MADRYLEENRFLYINSSLGADELLLESFTGEEAISHLFSFQLELWSENAGIKFEDILGQGISFGKDASENALRTAARAGFGRRSRVVRPKSQSATWQPPRCHSSVQAKTNAPAQPEDIAERTCQDNEWACHSSPFRRLSKPISPMIRGRLPARI